MLFNSYIFVMAFVPIMVLAYFTIGKLHAYAGKLVLIVGSLIFYSYTNLSILKLMCISLFINYLFSILIKRFRLKKICLAIPVIINVGLLLYYKYTNFAIININSWFGSEFALKELILPLGISFFTFQQIAFLVASYRNELPSDNIIDYIAYILYFPKLLMGPLMDPVDFISQLNDTRLKRVDWINIACGIKIFSFGLLKKVLLADTFAKAVAWGFSAAKLSSLDWIFIVIFYTFEIYFDFSGYSDMAVGVSMMFNITLPMNFDSPYKAISIRDFWKRWHMSLTKFLTKYVYIPLGGSKKGLTFTCINTMIVFLVSGIWHGSNWTFILWGLLHGAFSILDRFIEKSNRKLYEPPRWILTFILVNILWLLFRADSVHQWVDILQNICSFSNTTISNELLEFFQIPELGFITHVIPIFGKLVENIHGFMMLLFVVISSIICFFPENNYKQLRNITAFSMIFAAIAIVWGITCLGGESVFVYFNF